MLLWIFVIEFQSFNFENIFNVKRLKDLNNGSVCALYLPLDITRTALFWSLDIWQDLNPQTRIEWLIWGIIKLLYMVHNIFWGRYCLSLFIIPKGREILFDIFCICAFQVICWSMVRKLKSSILTKGSPFNSNFHPTLYNGCNYLSMLVKGTRVYGNGIFLNQCSTEYLMNQYSRNLLNPNTRVYKILTV